MHRTPSPNSMGMTGKADRSKCVKTAFPSKVWALVVVAVSAAEALEAVAASVGAVDMEHPADSVAALAVDLEVVADMAVVLAMAAAADMVVVLDLMVAESLLHLLSQTYLLMARDQMVRRARQSSSAMCVVFQTPISADR